MDLEVVMGMRSCRPDGWNPNIIMTVTITDQGTEELANEILRHREFLVSSGELQKRQKERAKFELLETMEGFLKDFVHGIDEGDYLEKLVDDLLQGRTNPRGATLEIAGRFAKDLSQLSGGRVKR